MSVRIVLDKPKPVYTSLDYVQGRVLLNLLTEEHVTTITVKLEGIARSRLPIPFTEGARENFIKAEVEFHKLLHVTETIFPPPQMRRSAGSSGFTLKPGKYEYPFSIRLPINNKCVPPGLLQKYAFNLEKNSLDIAKDAQHAQTTLPPSLSGIPGDEAWIRYFVKATVNTPAFYKQNARAVEFFVFLPIEPPRPPETKKESFARRQYQFAPELALPVKKPKKGWFQRSKSPPPPLEAGPPPRFSIETRLPSPAIIIPNEPIPLRLILIKLEPYTAMVFIRTLQIRLRCYTTIRAHQLTKTAAQTIPVYANQKLCVPVGDSSIPEGCEMEVDSSKGWTDAMLPDTVAPSFQTCNISRFYEMEITVGVSNGMNGGVNTIPLIMPIEVYSGITPPPDLVRFASVRSARQSFPPALPSRTNTVANGFGFNSATASPATPIAPQRSRTSAILPDAPPPTYEEALAADFGPVDGPRPRMFPQDSNYFVPGEELEERNHK